MLGRKQRCVGCPAILFPFQLSASVCERSLAEPSLSQDGGCLQTCSPFFSKYTAPARPTTQLCLHRGAGTCHASSRDLLEQLCSVHCFSRAPLCRLDRYLCNKLQASLLPCTKKPVKPISETKLPIIYMPLLTLKRKTADDNITSDRSGICC